MADSIVDILIQFGIDPRSRDATRFLNRFKLEIRSLEDQTGRLETGLRGLAGELERDIAQFNEGANAAERQANALKDVTRETQRATQASRQLTSTQGRGGRGARGFLGQFGRGVRAAPAIPIPGVGLTSEPLSKALIAIDSLGVSVAQLGLVAVPLTAAFVGLNAVLEIQKRREEELRDAIRLRLDAEEQTAAFLATATEQERRDRIEGLEQELAGERQLLSEREQRLQTFRSEISSYNELEEAAMTAADAFGFGSDQYLELAAQLESVDIDKLRREFEELEPRVEESGTTIAGLEAEIGELNTGTAALVEETEKATEATNERVESLKAEDAILRQANDELARRIKNLDAARASITENFFNPLLSLIGGASGFFETQANITGTNFRGGILDELGEDIARIRSRQNEQIAQIRRTLQDRQRRAQQTFNNALVDLDIQTAERRLQVQEDFQEDVIRITRRFSRESFNAIAERDALAFLQASQQRDDDLEDANRARDLELRQLDRYYDDRKRIIDRRFQQELDEALRAATQARDIAVQKANAEITIATQEAQALISVEQQKQAAIINQAVQGANSTLSIWTSFWNAFNAVAASNTGTSTSTSTALVPQTVSTGGFQLSNVPTFARGGTPAGGMILVGERGPELVNVGGGTSITPLSRGGGNSVTIMLEGETRDSTMRKIESVLVKAGAI